MIWAMGAMVASSQSAQRLFSDVIPWILALIAATLAGGVAIYLIRRTLRRESGSTGGFTLQDLRAMHTAGELSDEEFARAKAAMIGRLRAAVDSHGPQSAASNESDTSDAT